MVNHHVPIFHRSHMGISAKKYKEQRTIFLVSVTSQAICYSTSHLSNDREVQRLAGLDLTTEIWNCNNRVLWNYKHLDYIVFRVVPSRPVAASCIVRHGWQVDKSDRVTAKFRITRNRFGVQPITMMCVDIFHRFQRLSLFEVTT